MTEDRTRDYLSELPPPRASMPEAERIWALAALEEEFRKRAPRMRPLVWINAAGQAAFALGVLVAVAVLAG